MTEDDIEHPTWDGNERRQIAANGRRLEDAANRSLPKLISIIGLVGVLVAWGVAWGTAQATSAGKVDKAEQIKIDAQQDQEREIIRLRLQLVEANANRIIVKLDSISFRVTQIACDGKPASCR